MTEDQMRKRKEKTIYIAIGSTVVIALCAVVAIYLFRKYRHKSIFLNTSKSTDVTNSSYDIVSGSRFSTTNTDSILSVESGKSLSQLASICNQTPGCVGFDNKGVLKECQDSYLEDNSGVIYIRKGTNPKFMAIGEIIVSQKNKSKSSIDGSTIVNSIKEAVKWCVDNNVPSSTNIIVETGTYYESNLLLKNQIICKDGVTLVSEGEFPIFKDETNIPTRLKILGFPKLKHTGTKGDRFFYIVNQQSTVDVQFSSIKITNSAEMMIQNSSVNLNCLEISGENLSVSITSEETSFKVPKWYCNGNVSVNSRENDIDVTRLKTDSNWNIDGQENEIHGSIWKLASLNTNTRERDINLKISKIYLSEKFEFISSGLTGNQMVQIKTCNCKNFLVTSLQETTLFILECLMASEKIEFNCQSTTYNRFQSLYTKSSEFEVLFSHEASIDIRKLVSDTISITSSTSGRSVSLFGMEWETSIILDQLAQFYFIHIPKIVSSNPLITIKPLSVTLDHITNLFITGTFMERINNNPDPMIERVMVIPEENNLFLHIQNSSSRSASKTWIQNEANDIRNDQSQFQGIEYLKYVPYLNFASDSLLPDPNRDAGKTKLWQG